MIGEVQFNLIKRGYQHQGSNCQQFGHGCFVSNLISATVVKRWLFLKALMCSPNFGFISFMCLSCKSPLCFKCGQFISLFTVYGFNFIGSKGSGKDQTSNYFSVPWQVEIRWMPENSFTWDILESRFDGKNLFLSHALVVEGHYSDTLFIYIEFFI
jgi:hypothetical protein